MKEGGGVPSGYGGYGMDTVEKGVAISKENGNKSSLEPLKKTLFFGGGYGGYGKTVKLYTCM